MDYQHFDARAFAADEYFQQWVLLPDNTNDLFWQSWIKSHPEKKEVVEEARQIVLMLGYIELPIYTAEINYIKTKIFGKIDEGVNGSSVQPVVRTLYHRWYWLAATLTGLLILTLATWTLMRNNQYIEYATDYGEIKEFYLPDGSLVVLNANSILKHPKQWEEAHARMVWLEGEAFFHVKRHFIDEVDKSASSPGLAKFVVHADDMDVEVLGTEFNVNHREDKTEVTLKSGKVKLAVQTNQEKEEIEMQPGELVKFTQKNQSIEKMTVDPATRIAWKERLLVFDHLTLKEIADRLEDTYGVQVIFEEPELATKRFKGFVPAHNLDMLLEAFSRLYQMEVTREGENIIFHRAKKEAD